MKGGFFIKSKLTIYLMVMLMLFSLFQGSLVFARGPNLHNDIIHEDVIAAFKTDEYVKVVVVLEEQANTEEAAKAAKYALPSTATIQSKLAARFAVVDSLHKTAERTQGPLLSYVESQHESVKNYRSLSIINAICLEATEKVVRDIARRPEVKCILYDAVIPMEVPEVKPCIGPDQEDIEWNITRVGAPAVWDEFNLDGSGVVVGIIDTGVDWQHPAIMRKWRGYNQNGTDPTYSWFDPVYGSEMPSDADGHGTHVTGTILGSDPEGLNNIGVAPGATWIAARVFGSSGGQASHILAAGEWMLAPGGDPAKAPDIINNSWGNTYPGYDEFFRIMVQNWRSAGILPVFAAGNLGVYGSGSVTAPGNYPESFSVAATDRDNFRAEFSSQGPAPYDALKPDISAPGVDIRSSVPNNNYAIYNGTSMAAPHISGVAALLSQIRELTPTDIEYIIRDSAIPLTDEEYTEAPNYGYGYGLVDAYTAVVKTMNDYCTVSGSVLYLGEDTLPPLINHLTAETVYTKQDAYIYSEISDDIAVAKAEAWVKQSEDWAIVPMERVDGNRRNGWYKGIIPSKFVQGPVQYKIRAIDWGGNEESTSLYSITDIVDKAAPGAVWDFCVPPSGWTWDGSWEWGSPATGPVPLIGDKYMSSNLYGNSGAQEGWLMSPPLDLSDTAHASLRLGNWYDCYSFDYLSVYVVADGEAELVEVNSGQEKKWKNLYIDLNDYAGLDEVYVAFDLKFTRYSNRSWNIDDVQFWGEDYTAPGTPANVQTKVGNGIELKWEEPASDYDLAGYNVYRSHNSGIGYQLLSTTDLTTITDTDVQQGIHYFYVITAFDHSGNESGLSAEVSVEAPEVEVVYSSNFEASNGNFVPNPGNYAWEWGIPTSGPGKAWSGNKVWATVLTGNHTDSNTSWIESPVIDLSDHNSAAVEFKHWFDLEYFFDYGEVWVSDIEADEDFLLAEFTGRSARWLTNTLSLDDFAGKRIKIVFVMVPG